MPDRMGAEPAALDRTSDAFSRVLPAFEAYLAGHAAGPYPPTRADDLPLDLGLPAAGVGLDRTLDELGAFVASGSRLGAPGFLGFITTAATTAPAVAAAATAIAGGQRYMLHAFNRLEHVSLAWLAELCGLPAGVTGVYTSGGSSANLLALGAARQAAYERLGVDVAEDGALPSPRGRIYASVLAHRTIHRSAAVLGLGRRGVAAIPVDERGRIRLDELESAVEADRRDGIVPIALVAIAGTTDTGSVDPIDGVAEVARRHGTWTHVDGAYGLLANASPTLSPLFAGLEAADSWIVDPHKWLATGVGVAATFVRDGDVLTRAFAEGDAAYLEGAFRGDEATARSQFDQMGGRWADQSLELSAPPRGALVWSVLREIGRDGVAARIERHVGFARRLAGLVEAHPRLVLLDAPQLSIVCFRYDPGGRTEPELAELNSRILERLRHETALFPSSTLVGGRLAIRPCFINPRTTEAEVTTLAEAVVRFGDALRVA